MVVTKENTLKIDITTSTWMELSHKPQCASTVTNIVLTIRTVVPANEKMWKLHVILRRKYINEKDATNRE